MRRRLVCWSPSAVHRTRSTGGILQVPSAIASKSALPLPVVRVPGEANALVQASIGIILLYSPTLGSTVSSPLFTMNTAANSVMTVKEVADYLRVNQRTVYRLAVDKKLPGFKVGTTWRFKRADIDRWIDAQAAAGMLDHGAEDGHKARTT